MADNSRNRDQSHDQNRDPKELQREAAERGAPSKGMTSPDSTQVPLRADTGEPDENALGGRSGNRGDQSSRDQSDRDRSTSDRSRDSSSR